MRGGDFRHPLSQFPRGGGNHRPLRTRILEVAAVEALDHQKNPPAQLFLDRYDLYTSGSFWIGGGFFFRSVRSSGAHASQTTTSSVSSSADCHSRKFRPHTFRLERKVEVFTRTPSEPVTLGALHFLSVSTCSRVCKREVCHVR